MKYIQPQVFLNSFTCPHCGAIAKQDWWMKRWSVDQPNGNKDIHPLRVGTCHHCQKQHYGLMIKCTFLTPEMLHFKPRNA